MPPQFLPGPGVPGLVSVVIPCYNRADIVGETIDSVLAQSYQQLEIIVIDDGSTDGTSAAVGRYTDPRIRYIYKPNGGLSSARNAGLDAARGEYIAFLDSDDLWQSWKLKAQIEILSRYPSVGLVWSDMSTFEAAGRILADRHLREYYSAYAAVNLESRHARAGNVTHLQSGAPQQFGDCPFYVFDIFHEMFSGNLVHPSTAVVRRQRLQASGPFEPEVTGHGAEDYHFYFRICALGPVAFLDAPTTLYRVHSAQLSTCNRLHEARGNLRVVTHWLDRRPATLPQPVVRKSLATSHAWLGAEELNAGDARAAARHLLESLRHDKKQPATVLLLILSLVPANAANALRRVKRTLRGALARPLVGVTVVFLDDGNIVFAIVDILQSGIGSIA